MKKFGILVCILGWCLFPSPVDGSPSKISRVVFVDPQGALSNFDTALLFSHKNTIFEPAFVQGDQKTLEDYLRDQGYFFARVVVQRKKNNGKMTLKFQIRSGPRVEITSIKFKANVFFDGDTLGKIFRGFLKQSPYPFYHPWRWLGLRPNPFYIPKKIRTALKKLQNHYGSQGFLEARAELTKVDFSVDKTTARLFIQVKEGPRYRWGKVSFRGDPSLKDVIEKFSGRPFSRKQFLALLQKHQKLWRQQGYFQGKISYRWKIRKKTKSLDLQIQAIKGPQTVIGKISFVGHHTRDRVLRSRLKIYPGEVLSQKKWQESLAGLRQSGIFKKVKFSLEKSLFPFLYDLKITLEEKPDGQLQILGGFSSDLGFFGGGGFKINNFDLSRLPGGLLGKSILGGGQKLKIQTLWGERASRSELTFEEPFLWGHPVGFVGKLFYRKWDYASYLEQKWGWEGLFYRKFSLFRVDVGYRWEQLKMAWSTTAPLPSDLTSLSRGLTLATGLFSLSLSSSTVRWPFSLAIRTELGHGRFGSQVDFFRLIAPFKIKIPLWSKIFFQAQFRAGWGRQLNGQDLPYPLRFFLGGQESLRGFAYWKLEPFAQGIPLGGSAFWSSRGEVHIPIWKWIWAIGFVDVGDLGQDFSVFRHGHLRLSVGGGFRFYLFSSQIPLALDFGIPLLKQPLDQRELVSFALEMNF